ncbi:MAG: NYN domain-containing protein, partial [Cyanobacteria bacterium J06554_11]
MKSSDSKPFDSASDNRPESTLPAVTPSPDTQSDMKKVNEKDSRFGAQPTSSKTGASADADLTVATDLGAASDTAELPATEKSAEKKRVKSSAKAPERRTKPRTRPSAKPSTRSGAGLSASKATEAAGGLSAARTGDLSVDGTVDGVSTFSNSVLGPVGNSEKAEKNSNNRAFSLSASYQPAVHTVNQNSDRIAIFIDGSNLFYAASHLNIEVDYRRLLSSLVRGRRLLRAYFYTGVDPQNEKQRGFLLWLNRHGHRVVSKELTHLPDGSRKANMHVEMAVDMMRIAEYCPTLTLLGGDGNLAYALKVLSQRGTFIEVVSLQSMTSDSLIDLADSYTDLADLRDDI